MTSPVLYPDKDTWSHEYRKAVLSIEQLQAKVAELEAEVGRLSVAHVKACQAFADSQAELAIAEEHNARLRSLLDDIRGDINPVRGYADELEKDIVKALSLPASREALDAYVANKIEEYKKAKLYNVRKM